MRNLMILVAIGVILGALSVTIFLLTRGSSSTTESGNLVILLDRSTAMGSPLDGNTKLEVAIGIIDVILDQRMADLQNQAIRQYGGPCDGNNSELVVTFGQIDKDTVKGTLSGISIDGETTLVGGIKAIPEDFSRVVTPEGTSNHLVIITGAGDSCGADLAAALTRLRASAIVVDLIGLDIPLDQRAPLERAARESGAGISFANTKDELASFLTATVNQPRADNGGGGGGGASGLAGPGGTAGGGDTRSVVGDAVGGFGYGVQPTLRVSPNRGDPGSVVRILGNGFPPISAISNLAIGSYLVLPDPAPSTDSNGNFNVEIVVPDLPDGTATVSVVVTSARSDVEFIVQVQTAGFPFLPISIVVSVIVAVMVAGVWIGARRRINQDWAKKSEETFRSGRCFEGSRYCHRGKPDMEAALRKVDSVSIANSIGGDEPGGLQLDLSEATVDELNAAIEGYRRTGEVTDVDSANLANQTLSQLISHLGDEIIDGEISISSHLTGSNVVVPLTLFRCIRGYWAKQREWKGTFEDEGNTTVTTFDGNDLIDSESVQRLTTQLSAAYTVFIQQADQFTGFSLKIE